MTRLATAAAALFRHVCRFAVLVNALQHMEQEFEGNDAIASDKPQQMPLQSTVVVEAALVVEEDAASVVT